MVDHAIPQRSSGKAPVSPAGLCLGLAAGGFIDGILLHQVLQWHHLLSNLEDAPFGDLRVQILADGLFHLAMYVVGAVGLWLLWRGPRSPRFWADFLIGFGLWHILDAVLVHWILGLHNIRIDVENRLVWDLIFFALGVLAAVLGLFLTRRRGSPPGVAAALGVTVILCGGGFWALQPPPGAEGVVALFRPGVEAPAVFAALHEIDGRVIWTSPEGGVWLLAMEDTARARALYRAGALLVSRGGSPFGCFSASRAP